MYITYNQKKQLQVNIFVSLITNVFFFVMQRLLFCLLLMFTSCNNNNIEKTEMDAQYSTGTLSENESLIYDNYKFSNIKKGMNVTLVDEKPDVAFEQQSDLCITSCFRKPLKIVILPMNFGSAAIMNEIKNTLTILKFGVNYSKYNIQTLEGTIAAMQSLSTIEPDIIIGPFNEKDTLLLQRQIGLHHINIPIVSLATKQLPGDGLYNFGYNVESGVLAIMRYAKDKHYKNLVMFAPNNEIGGNSYKMFLGIAKANKQDISRVELYEPDSDDITKYITRLKSSAIQTYYENLNSGKIQKDDFGFTSQIVATEGNTVTHTSGQKFYKKYKKIDAIIIDSSSKDFKKIYDAIASEEAFKDIPIIGSPRIVDSVIELVLGGSNGSGTIDVSGSVIGGYTNIEKEIIFPANYEKYKDYYEVYKNTFNQPPTRLSATIYETLQYILKVHQVKAIDNISGIAMNKINITDGVNGQLMTDRDGRTIQRVIGIHSFKNGVVKEVPLLNNVPENIDKLLQE